MIRYVIAALRVVRDPDDPVALEAFARCVLSEHFYQEVEGAIGTDGEFLTDVRTLARARPAHEPDTKKLWRLVYQVENLRALARTHRSVQTLVNEILCRASVSYATPPRIATTSSDPARASRCCATWPIGSNARSPRISGL